MPINKRTRLATTPSLPADSQTQGPSSANPSTIPTTQDTNGDVDHHFERVNEVLHSNGGQVPTDVGQSPDSSEHLPVGSRSLLRLTIDEARDIVGEQLSEKARTFSELPVLWGKRFRDELDKEVFQQYTIPRLGPWDDLFDKKHEARTAAITEHVKESARLDPDLLQLMLDADPQYGESDVIGAISSAVRLRYRENLSSNERVREKNLEEVSKAVYMGVAHHSPINMEEARRDYRTLEQYLICPGLGFPERACSNLLSEIRDQLGDRGDALAGKSFSDKIAYLQSIESELPPYAKVLLPKLSVAAKAQDIEARLASSKKIPMMEHLDLIQQRIAVTRDAALTSRPRPELFQSLRQDFERIGEEITERISSEYGSLSSEEAHRLGEKANQTLDDLHNRLQELDNYGGVLAKERLFLFYDKGEWQVPKNLQERFGKSFKKINEFMDSSLNVAMSLCAPRSPNEKPTDKVIAAPTGHRYTRQEAIEIFRHTVNSFPAEFAKHEATLSPKEKELAGVLSQNLESFCQFLEMREKELAPQNTVKFDRLEGIDRSLDNLAQTLIDYQKTQMVELNAVDRFDPAIPQSFQATTKSMLRDFSKPGIEKRWAVASHLATSSLRQNQEARLKILMKQHGFSSGSRIGQFSAEECGFWSKRLERACSSIQEVFEESAHNMQELGPIYLEQRALELDTVGQHFAQANKDGVFAQKEPFTELSAVLHSLPGKVDLLFKQSDQDIVPATATLQEEFKQVRQKIKDCKAIFDEHPLPADATPEQRQTHLLIQKYFQHAMARILYLEINLTGSVKEHLQNQSSKFGARVSFETAYQQEILTSSEQVLSKEWID